jgi:hypothetical protein
MPKVFGLHEIELKPGVQPEEYERFSAERSHRRPSSRGGKPIFSRVSGAHAPESISCSWKSRVWRHVIGTSPDRARSRRSSLGSLNNTQKPQRHWRNGRNGGHSDRKPTFRPITSPSLSSTFCPHPGVLAIRRLDLLATCQTYRLARTMHHALTNPVRP